MRYVRSLMWSICCLSVRAAYRARETPPPHSTAIKEPTHGYATYIFHHQADATRRNLTGKINAMIEDAGLRIIAQKRIHMTKDQASKFYAVHSERPFYNDLVEFMTSGPVVVQVLEGDDAIARYREVMGATKPG